MFALFEAFLRCRVVGRRAVEHHFTVCTFFHGRFFDVSSDPIEYLAIDEGVFDHFNHLVVGNTGGFEPYGVEAFAKIRMIIRMQFSGEMQTDLSTYAANASIRP